MTSKKRFNALFEQEIRIHRKGTHTMVPPREEGCYPIWARDGSFRGFVEVVHEGRDFTPVYYFRSRRSAKAADIHVGWWWSKPFPALPNAPEWGEPANDIETAVLAVVAAEHDRVDLEEDDDLGDDEDDFDAEAEGPAEMVSYA